MRKNKRGRFHCIVDSSWGSSGKSAVSTRIAENLGIENTSSNNNPNAGHCQSYNTWVITEKGLSLLGDVVTHKNSRKVVNKTGNLVNTSDFVDDGEAWTNLVELENGVALEPTDIHPYYVWNSSLGEFEWVKSMNLDSEVHYFLFPKNVFFPDNDILHNELKNAIKPNKIYISNPDCKITWATYLGLLVGDGYYAGKKVDITFHNSQGDSAVFVEEMYKQMGVSCKRYPVGDKDCFTLSSTTTSGLKELFQMSGLERTIKDKKSTPKSILGSSKKLIAAYLRGLFDADGTSKHNRIVLSNCSPAVVFETQQMLYILGINSSIYKYEDKRDNYVRLPQYNCSVAGKENMQLFLSTVGFLSKVKQNKAIEFINNLSIPCGKKLAISKEQSKLLKQLDIQQNKKAYLVTNNLIFDNKEIISKNEILYPLVELVSNYHVVGIKEVIRENCKQNVYDLTVPSDHSYLANGCISHNTVVKDGDSFVFKSLPGPAILNNWGVDSPYADHEPIVSYIGPNSAFDIKQFYKEIAKTNSVLGKNLFIHSRATITEQLHRDAEGPGGSMSTLHISSTMSGAGATYAMKAMRMLNTKYAEEIPELKDGILQPWDFYDQVQLALNRGEDFIHEVSQGFALSLDYGTHARHCTFRNATPQQAYADFLIHPHQVGDVYLNLRTFPIRVGSNFDGDGNMIGYSGDWLSDQLELNWEEIGIAAGMPQEEVDILAEKERTTVTKKIRRVASFSHELLRYSARMCGATKLVLNFTSYLDWESHNKHGGSEEYRLLNSKIHKFVDKLETLTGLPVIMLGTGADHNSYILPYDYI